MSHSFTTTVDYADYLAANRLMVRRRFLWRGLTRAFVGLWVAYSLLLLIFAAMDDGLTLKAFFWSASAALAFAGVVIAILVLITLWRIPRSSRKTWSQLHLDGLPTTQEFDETGIRIANERGTANFEWHMLTSWIEDNRLLMIFRTRLAFHLVPKDQVDPRTLAALRLQLIQSGVSTRC